MGPKSPWIAGIFATVGLLLVIGCASGQSPKATTDPASAETLGETSLSRERTIVLGDIDVEEPAKEIKRFLPLADHLAANLEEYGIECGSVVEARDIDEMGRFLKDEVGDVYFDSAYPSLQVQELSGSEVVSRWWKLGFRVTGVSTTSLFTRIPASGGRFAGAE